LYEKACYSSLLLVRKSSGFRTFAQLRGRAVVAFNDRNSLSGYHCLRFHLHRAGLAETPYFKGAVETGGHQRSLEALLGGRADVAAVDESVLRKLRQDRAWRRRLNAEVGQLDDLRVLGPWPGQPFVAPRYLGPSALAELTSALCSAKPAALRPLGWRKIVRVDRGSYAPVRELLGACAAKGSEILCPAGQFTTWLPGEDTRANTNSQGEPPPPPPPRRSKRRGGSEASPSSAKRLKC